MMPDHAIPVSRTMSAARGLQGAADAEVWDCGSSPETPTIDLARRYDLIIGRRIVQPHTGRYTSIVNPANGRSLAECAEADADDIDAAVDAGRRAWRTWSRMPSRQRAAVLDRIAARIEAHSEELAAINAISQGLPVRVAREIEIPLAARWFSSQAGWCTRLQHVSAGVTAQPRGVCGLIADAEFPLATIAARLAPALASGNTCVIAPSVANLLSAHKIAEVLKAAELPAGVVNVVTGTGQVAEMLAAHRGVDLISIDAPMEQARALARVVDPETALLVQPSASVPTIVFADASVDQAIESIVHSTFMSQGQIIGGGSKLLVEESILEEVIVKLEQRVKTIRVGDPFDHNTDLGPVSSRRKLERIEAVVAAGVTEGARLHQHHDASIPEHGNWCRPRFFSDVHPAHQLWQTDLEGPLMTISSFRTPREAVKRINTLPASPAAAVWTDKGSKMYEIARQLRFGVIWCNTDRRVDPASPFGGSGPAGRGWEGAATGIRSYLRFVHS